ncbi:MAG: hypothetical protein ABIQ93_17420 [Saprospiraceae bacterium]
MKKQLLLALLLTPGWLISSAQTKHPHAQFTESLLVDSCTFLTTGRTPYFILEPGYQLVLEGVEGRDSGRLVITVLKETRKIGNVETRIVEENESVNGQTVEISRNFFAYCRQTGSIYYFGEEVDMYKHGKISSHEGAWSAVGNNRAGVAMPGLPMLGARYYQEIAPGLAMDRAEIVSLEATKQTLAGNFAHCLMTKETTPLEPLEKEFKLYAPGIGLIQDEYLLLVRYGFAK